MYFKAGGSAGMPTGQPTHQQAARNHPQGMPLDNPNVPAHLAGTVFPSRMSQYDAREILWHPPADVPLPPVIPPDSESDSEDQTWGDPREDQCQDGYALEPYRPHQLLPSWQLANPLPPNQFPVSQYPLNQYPTSHDLPYEFSLVAEPEPQHKRQRIETPPIFDKPPPVPQQRTALQLSGKPVPGASVPQALQAFTQSLERGQVAPIIDDSVRGQQAAAVQEPPQAQRPPLTLEEADAKAKNALQLHAGKRSAIAQIIKQLASLRSYSEMIDHVLKITDSSERSTAADALIVCARRRLCEGSADEAQLMAVLFALLGRMPHSANLKGNHIRNVLGLSWRLPPELGYLGEILRGRWPETPNFHHNAISRIVHDFCATAPVARYALHPPERGAQTPSKIVQWHHYNLRPAAPTHALANRSDRPQRGGRLVSQHPMVFSHALENSNDAVIREAMPEAGEEDNGAALISALKKLGLTGQRQIRYRDALVEQSSYAAMIQYVCDLDPQCQLEVAEALVACGLILLEVGKDELAHMLGLLVLTNNRLPRQRKLSGDQWRALLPPTWLLPAKFEELRKALLDRWKATSLVPQRKFVAELVHERYEVGPDSN